ncbi:DNA utilization protein GntX [Enterobacter sp. ECC-175]|uniref:DNA utilization protein GntX n=1 Tax=unclassified Enterobacter TaxID=2608935 RepID=UPI000D406E5E|nr:DNA utilization protein GntX [Enterobacter sp. RIT 418]RAU34241.1 DNA utilization protein GntX [Enterobacter sp. RIT 418]
MLTAPGLCWLCRMPLALSGWGICSVCTRAQSGRLCGCPQCGLPAVSQTVSCGRCLRKSPPWHALVAVDDYVLPLSRLIHRLKFSHQSSLAPPLARLMLLAVLQARRTRALPRVDLIVNVPLYHRRHWRRGYNQSDLLCRPLARWLGCRYEAAAIARLRATAIQHQLTARQRKRNLKNAFRLELPVNGLHIAIVDDVVTTGSTVAELSRLLLQSGAASVQVWCLCRTL